MPWLSLKGHIIVSDDDLPRVLKALPKHIALSRAEQGCLIFNVSQDSENANKFYVYEEFIDREALDAHRRRAKRTRWASVTAGVERYCEICEESYA